MPKHIHGSIFPTSATAYPWLLWRVKKGRRWLVLEIPQCPPSCHFGGRLSPVFISKGRRTRLLKPSRATYGFDCHRRGVGVVQQKSFLCWRIWRICQKIIRHQVKRLQCLYSNLFGNILCILRLPQISSLKQCPPFISGHIPMAFFKIPSITR